MKKSICLLIILAVAFLCIAVIAGQSKSKGKKTITLGDMPAQSIQCTTKLRSGNYKVVVTYAQPFFGSAISIEADGQQIAALVPQTSSADDFQTMEAGVLSIIGNGNADIVLRGIQQGIVPNADFAQSVTDALPVIKSITFVPTAQTATSQTKDILKEFKGKSIFDGETFEGWEPNDEDAMAHFRIEDGVIVGGSLEADLADNHFIRTDRDYQDFELRLKYKVTPTDDSYNGGIQIRSHRSTLPGQGCEMVGYQADILTRRIGGLYDEKRRSDFLGLELGLPKGYRPDEWNEFIIRCEGPRVRLWLNGVQTTDYIEPYTDRPLEGFGTVGQTGRIALQIHKGTPCEIRYKDILLEEL